MDRSLSPKPTHISNRNKNDVDDTIVINEKINLKKSIWSFEYDLQFIWKINLKIYARSISSIKSDIEDGNLCDVLLKLNEDNKKKSNSPSPLLLTRLTTTEKIVT